MQGTWRCVCELDTENIHVLAASNHAKKLAIGNLHLLPRAVYAGLDVSGLEPSHFSGAEAVDEQCAWYVEVCVCGLDTAHIHGAGAGRIQPCCGSNGANHHIKFVIELGKEAHNFARYSAHIK